MHKKSISNLWVSSIFGYTLAELLVTIGVFSILLSIGTLSFTNIRIQNQLDLTAAQIKSELLRVKSENKNHINSGVYFEVSRYVYFIGDTYTEGAPENEEHSLPSNLSLSSITFTNSIAKFDPVTGYLVGYTNPSHVIISAGGGVSRTVAVNQWGSIEIQ